MAAIDPEIIAVFIENEELCRNFPRNHPLPLGHNGLRGAEDAQDVIALIAQQRVEPFPPVCAGIFARPIDRPLRLAERFWKSGITGNQIELHLAAVDFVQPRQHVFKQLSRAALDKEDAVERWDLVGHEAAQNTTIARR